MSIRIAVSALAAAVAVGIVAGLSFTKSSVTTINEASRNSPSGVVTLEGKVFLLGENRFVLVDRTGKAQLETCPTWYKRVRLRNGEKAVVTGEKLPGRPSANGADLVVSVFTVDGSETGLTTVRDHPGKPPWAFARAPEPVSVATLGTSNGAK